MTMSDDDINTKRHTQWFAVAAFSTIALVAITVNTGKISNQKQAVKWAVSGVSIALSFSALAVLAHVLLKDKFAATTMEGGLSFLTVVFWVASMPAIMNPDNKLAVSSYAGGILNQNLYFFSWGSVIMSFVVLSNYLSQRNAKRESVDDPNQRPIAPWVVLIVTSCIVMVAASRMYQDWNCDTNTPTITNYPGNVDANAVCERTDFAISLGVISAVFALICVAVNKFMKGRTGSMTETFLVWLLMIFWTFGVAYLTFNNTKSPALLLGNVYFFTWASWALVLFMASASAQKLRSGTETTPEETKDEQGNVKNEPVAAGEPDVEQNVAPEDEPQA